MSVAVPRNVPRGDWHVLVPPEAGTFAPPDGAGSPGAIAEALVPAVPAVAVVPSSGAVGLDTERDGGTSTQVQAVGQSASATQLVALGVQAPKSLVVVTHESPGGTGALRLVLIAAPPSAAGVGAPAPGEPVVLPAVPALPPPEQALVTIGVHVKPSPHSASALQGSCHLYAHVEMVVVVHEPGEGAGASGHGTPFAQADAVPPAHALEVEVWHTIVAPQSASLVQRAASQYPIVCVPASAAGAGRSAQSRFGAHAGFATGTATGTSRHVKPFPQSAAVWHCWASAEGAKARRAVNAPTLERSFVRVIDMGGLRS